MHMMQSEWFTYKFIVKIINTVVVGYEKPVRWTDFNYSPDFTQVLYLLLYYPKIQQDSQSQKVFYKSDIFLFLFVFSNYIYLFLLKNAIILISWNVTQLLAKHHQWAGRTFWGLGLQLVTTLQIYCAIICNSLVWGTRGPSLFLEGFKLSMQSCDLVPLYYISVVFSECSNTKCCYEILSFRFVSPQIFVLTKKIYVLVRVTCFAFPNTYDTHNFIKGEGTVSQFSCPLELVIIVIIVSLVRPLLVQTYIYENICTVMNL